MSFDTGQSPTTLFVKPWNVSRSYGFCQGFLTLQGIATFYTSCNVAQQSECMKE